MTVRVGVVGAGVMGAAHIRTLREQVPRCAVTAVFDADAARAAEAAGGASTPASASELVESAEVDAVVVCSPDFTHAELVLACLEAGKPVLCEKPLALTVEETRALVDAEVAGGRRLVQVGFMRRYDVGFNALRDAVRGGELGEVRLAHLVHRNPSSAPSTSSANVVTGSMIHELDQVRWLLDDEIAAIDISSPISEGFKDPQLAVIQMRSGVLVTVDVFVNASYGYDVRCEVVGTRGAANAAGVSATRMLRDGQETATLTGDFVARFADAYRRELTDWVLAAEQGGARGASTWDGHCAIVAAECGVESLTHGFRTTLPELQTPALYT